MTNPTSPLNGPLELAIRVVTVLAAAEPAHLDLNRMVLLDHALLHSADLGGPESLHPAVPIRSGELGMKRQRILDGVEVLLRAGLAHMDTDIDGIQFWASDRAAGFIRLLESGYAHALSARATWVIDRFGSLDDTQLRDQMRAVTGHWAEEFEQLDSAAGQVS